MAIKFTIIVEGLEEAINNAVQNLGANLCPKDAQKEEAPARRRRSYPHRGYGNFRAPMVRRESLLGAYCCKYKCSKVAAREWMIKNYGKSFVYDGAHVVTPIAIARKIIDTPMDATLL